MSCGDRAPSWASEPRSDPTALFDFPRELPQGLLYQPEFVTRDEEAALLAAIAPLPLREAKFREYFAKRRVAHFHDGRRRAALRRRRRRHVHQRAAAGVSRRVRDKVARWIDVEPSAFVHALVSEYRPGTPIGWHRDKPVYGIVVGISLAGWGGCAFGPTLRRTRGTPSCSTSRRARCT